MDNKILCLWFLTTRFDSRFAKLETHSFTSYIGWYWSPLYTKRCILQLSRFNGVIKILRDWTGEIWTHRGQFVNQSVVSSIRGIRKLLIICIAQKINKELQSLPRVQLMWLVIASFVLRRRFIYDLWVAVTCTDGFNDFLTIASAWDWWQWD